MPMRDRSKSSLCNSNCGEIEVFLNYQQHKFGKNIIAHMHTLEAVYLS